MKTSDRWRLAFLRSRKGDVADAFKRLRGLRRRAWLVARDWQTAWSWRDTFCLWLVALKVRCSKCDREFLTPRDMAPPGALRGMASAVCPACKHEAAFGGGA